MGFWVRLLVWIALLAVPTWLLAEPYHASLRATVSLLTGLELPRRALSSGEVQATQAMGAFVALCLASRAAPLRRRLSAIAIGLLALAALDVCTGLFVLRTEMLSITYAGLPHWLLALSSQVVSSPPWLAAPIAWLLLLGKVELKDMRAPS
jgi:hypothetical protein